MKCQQLTIIIVLITALIGCDKDSEDDPNTFGIAPSYSTVTEQCLEKEEPCAGMEYITRGSDSSTLEEHLKANAIGCDADFGLMCAQAIGIKNTLEGNHFLSKKYEREMSALKRRYPNCSDPRVSAPEPPDEVVQFWRNLQTRCLPDSSKLCNFEPQGLGRFAQSLDETPRKTFNEWLLACRVEHDKSACQKASIVLYQSATRDRGLEELLKLEGHDAETLISSCLLARETFASCLLVAEIAARNYACHLGRVFYRRAKNSSARVEAQRKTGGLYLFDKLF